MQELLKDTLIVSLAAAVMIYGPVTALAWERGPWRVLERVRELAPAGGELDRWISCGICMTPAVALIMIGEWALGASNQTLFEVLVLWLMTWGWLWVLIRMTRFGQA